MADLFLETVHWRVLLILKCRFSVVKSYNYCFYILLLTQFFSFFASLKHEKTLWFSVVFRGSRKEISSICVNLCMANVPRGKVELESSMMFHVNEV